MFVTCLDEKIGKVMEDLVHGRGVERRSFEQLAPTTLPPLALNTTAASTVFDVLVGDGEECEGLELPRMSLAVFEHYVEGLHLLFQAAATKTKAKTPSNGEPVHPPSSSSLPFDLPFSVFGDPRPRGQNDGAPCRDDDDEFVAILPGARVVDLTEYPPTVGGLYLSRHKLQFFDAALHTQRSVNMAAVTHVEVCTGAGVACEILPSFADRLWGLSSLVDLGASFAGLSNELFLRWRGGSARFRFLGLDITGSAPLQHQQWGEYVTELAAAHRLGSVLSPGLTAVTEVAAANVRSCFAARWAAERCAEDARPDLSADIHARSSDLLLCSTALRDDSAFDPSVRRGLTLLLAAEGDADDADVNCDEGLERSTVAELARAAIDTLRRAASAPRGAANPLTLPPQRPGDDVATKKEGDVSAAGTPAETGDDDFTHFVEMTGGAPARGGHDRGVVRRWAARRRSELARFNVWAEERRFLRVNRHNITLSREPPTPRRAYEESALFEILLAPSLFFLGEVLRLTSWESPWESARALALCIVVYWLDAVGLILPSCLLGMAWYTVDRRGYVVGRRRRKLRRHQRQKQQRSRDGSDERPRALPLADPFDAAVEHMRANGDDLRPGTDELLSLYGLYKAATVGRVKSTRPGMFDVRARAKWDAWSAVGGLSEAEARRRYVDRVCRISPSFNDVVVNSVQPRQEDSEQLADVAPANEGLRRRKGRGQDDGGRVKIVTAPQQPESADEDTDSDLESPEARPPSSWIQYSRDATILAEEGFLLLRHANVVLRKVHVLHTWRVPTLSCIYVAFLVMTAILLVTVPLRHWFMSVVVLAFAREILPSWTPVHEFFARVPVPLDPSGHILAPRFRNWRWRRHATR